MLYIEQYPSATQLNTLFKSNDTDAIIEMVEELKEYLDSPYCFHEQWDVEFTIDRLEKRLYELQ